MHKFALLVSAILLATQFSIAQNFSNNELFQQARQMAFSEDYKGAIQLLSSLHEENPENSDYSIFLARVYGWEKNYPQAISILEKVITKNFSFPQEALEVMTTIQMWAGNYSEVLKYSNLGIEKTEDPIFKVQKAKALVFLNRPHEAKKVLSEVLDVNKSNETALGLYTEIVQNYTHVFSASYTNTTFSSPPGVPWHSAWIYYKTNLGKIPVLAKYQFGKIYDRKGSQIEIEAYPKIARSGYFHLNAAVGLNNEVFPEFRAGAEYYHSINSKFDVSGGGRLLAFDSQNVYLLTGQVGYTTSKNLKFIYRPYGALTNDTWNLTHSLSLAISNPLKENIWRLDLQYGSIPYEYITESSFSNLETFRIGLQHQWRVSGNLLLCPIFMYENEEFLPSENRNRFNLQLITIFRF